MGNLISNSKNSIIENAISEWNVNVLNSELDIINKILKEIIERRKSSSRDIYSDTKSEKRENENIKDLKLKASIIKTAIKNMGEDRKNLQ